MSKASVDWVRTVRGLAISERLVLIELASWATKGTHEVFRSQGQLEEALEMVRSTVKKALAGLAEKGHIEVVALGNGKTTTTYRLNTRGSVSAPQGAEKQPPGGRETTPHKKDRSGEIGTDQEPTDRAEKHEQQEQPPPAAPQPSDPTPAADDAAAWDAILPRASVNAWGQAAKPFYRQACEALRTHGMVARFEVLYAEEAKRGRRRRGGVFFERLPELASQAAAEMTAELARANEPDFDTVEARAAERRERKRLEREAAAQQREAVCHG